MTTCIFCDRIDCPEDWHRLPPEQMHEPVTLTLPRSVLEHAAWLMEVNHGAWSGFYRALVPYLNDPKSDPSTPLA